MPTTTLFINQIGKMSPAAVGYLTDQIINAYKEYTCIPPDNAEVTALDQFA